MDFSQKLTTLSSATLEVLTALKLNELTIVPDYLTLLPQDSASFDAYVDSALKNGTLVYEYDGGIVVRLTAAYKIADFAFNYLRIGKPKTGNAKGGYVAFSVENFEQAVAKLEDVEINDRGDYKRVELKDSTNTFSVYITSNSFIAKVYKPSEHVSADKTSNSDQNELELEKAKRLELMAEFQNYRRRVEQERATFGAIANMGLIQEILEVYDDLEMAANDEASDVARCKEAMRLAQSKLSTATRNSGIEKIEVKVGDEFDKTTMEAISTVADAEQKNKVIAVISSAYKYVNQEGILKPAKVVVGR